MKIIIRDGLYLQYGYFEIKTEKATTQVVVTKNIVGEKMSDELITDIKKALGDALLVAYDKAPMAYRDQYGMGVPKIDVQTDGNVVSLVWLQGLPRFDTTEK